ncbi:hypothetical protein RLV_2106 (plasmid) [Rhizobium leguminosarum bv. viciae]|nr:hypothetical protein RLV_2106 [Rhizobium leguminosarum bv. viciae]
MVSTGANLVVSANAGALFPELNKSYPATADARKRIDFLLNHYKPRIDPRPDGYNPDGRCHVVGNLTGGG